MRIETILIGKPIDVEYNGKTISTGIFKNRVNGPILLRTLNLEGDGQADLKVHGGPDKALYAYGKDAYPAWRALRPLDEFADGAMGENLTFTELNEKQIHIGDIYNLGKSKVQVAQPRFPCFKLGIKFNDLGILKDFVALNRPGVYFRVLEEGLVQEGDELKLVSKGKNLASINELFEFQFGATISPERKKEILAIEGLPQYWKDKLNK